MLQDQRALNGVIQLTHIARPRVSDQAGLRLGREAHRGVIHFFDVLAQQPLGQRQNVGSALAQGPPGQRKHRQTIVKVFPEAPRRHFAGQVTVGGGDHPDIQADRLARTHPLHFTLLQHPQQLGLQRQGHLGNFIEQDAAAFGQLELARLRRHRAGEGALLVTEQGGLQHVVGNRRTVDRHKRLAGSRRLLVDIARQHLLAGARLAGDQHRGVALRHPSGQLQQLLAGRLIGYRPLAVGQRYLTQGMAGHQIEQGLGLEGFDQVIRRALAHGIHRPLHGRKSSHQQHRQLRVALAHQGQQLMTVHARHIDVANHQAEGLLGQGQQS